MNMLEYNTELANNVLSSLANIVQGNNESLFSPHDYLFENTGNHMNRSMNYNSDPQHLSAMLHQMFTKMSDNQTTHNISFSSMSSLSEILYPGSLSFGPSLPLSVNDANSYRLLSTISLWFTLICNPILVVVFIFENNFFKLIFFFLDFPWCHWQSAYYLYLNQL